MSLGHLGRALILGGDNRSALSAARSLGRGGVEVHVAWLSPHLAALRSRHIRVRHDLPLPSSLDDQWLRALVDLLQSERFDLVLPCDDPSLIPISLHRDALDPHTRLALPSEDAQRVMFDKIETVALAQRLGIPVPHGEVIDSAGQIPDIVERFKPPVVLKPRSSFTAHDLTNRGRVRCAQTRDAMRDTLEIMLRQGAVLVQENFIGTGVGVEMLVEHGETLLAFQHERLHEPLRGGGSSYRRSTSLDPELLAASESLMQALEHTGVAMVEFRRNRLSGEWALMEINGRLWGSLPLAIAAGADFPLHLHRLLVHDERRVSQGYRVGICCRNVRSDLRWMWQNLRADRSDPLLATRSLGQVAAEMLNVITLRERFDTFTLDDPVPGIVDLTQTIGSMAKAVLLRAASPVRRFPLLRRRRREHAVDILHGAQSLLFVCLGNICRSPFAELVARRGLPAHVKIASCGTYPVTGRHSPPEAIHVAQEHGFDLSSHRSRVITQSLVDGAEAIIVFDERNRRAIVEMFPTARARTFLLGSLLSGGSEIVRDPFRGDADDFRSVYREIVRAIDELALHTGVVERD